MLSTVFYEWFTYFKMIESSNAFNLFGDSKIDFPASTPETAKTSSSVIDINDEDKTPFYTNFVLDSKAAELLKCVSGKDHEKGIDIQTDFRFEVMRQNSAHDSTLTYLRLDTGSVETFSFGIGETDYTKVVFDGVNLTCLGGIRHQCQNLTAGWPGGPVPVVMLEVKFKPREGTFEKGSKRDWSNNKYSIHGTFYNAICGADGAQHMRKRIE